MYRTVEEFERGADTADVMRELTAQYEAVRHAACDHPCRQPYGQPVRHGDGRSHFRTCCVGARAEPPFRLFRKVDPADPLLGPMPGVERAAAKASALAGVLGVGAARYLLSHPFGMQEGETYESFKRMGRIGKLYRLPFGICETVIHPAGRRTIRGCAGRFRIGRNGYGSSD